MTTEVEKANNDNLVTETFIVKPENIDELCRLCANTDNQLMPIFSGEGLEHKIINKIRQHLPIIKVTEKDRLPLSICYHCASNLIAWHSLYEGCKLADTRLRELIGEKDGKKNIENDDVQSDKRSYDSFDYDSVHIAYDEDSNDNEISRSEVLEDIIQVTSANTDAKKADGNYKPILEDVAEVVTPDEATLEEDDMITGDIEVDDGDSNIIIETEGLELENLTEEQCDDTADEGDPLMIKPANTAQKSRTKRGSTLRKDDHFKCIYCTATFKDSASLARHHDTHKSSEDESDDSSDISYTVRSRRSRPIKRPNRGINNRRLLNSVRKRRLAVTLNRVDVLSRKSQKKINTRSLGIENIVVTPSVVRMNKNGNTSAYFECNHCGNKFESKFSLMNHVRSAHKVTYNCDICGRKFQYRYQLERHMSSKTIHDTPPVDNTYTCDTCKRVFPAKYRLARHVKVHMTQPDSDGKYTCKICKEQFDDKQLLSDHQRCKGVHAAKSNIYECDMCGARFSARRKLLHHVNKKCNARSSEGDDDTFTCVYCDRTFISRHSLEHHMIVVHIKKNNYASISMKGYCCEICQEGFITSSELLHHRKRKHDAPEMTWTSYARSVSLLSLCGKCKKYFKRGAIDDHRCDFQSDSNSTENAEVNKEEMEEKKYFCDVCGIRYEWKCELRLHRENQHPGAFSWNKFTKISDPAVICEVCDRAFKEESLLQSHECVKADKGNFDLLARFICETCGRCFLYKDGYVRHLYEKHVGVSKELDSATVFHALSKDSLKPRKKPPTTINCAYCPVRCVTRKGMLDHLRAAHDIETESPYICRVCNKAFRRYQSLDTHNKMYHPENETEEERLNILNSSKVIINGEEAHHCNVCSRNIFVATEFLAHYRFHNLEKDFTCEQCGWQTRTKYQLNKHIKVVHLNVRDYICDLCGKTFNRKQTRDEHRRLHTGERPFSCEVCGNTFVAMNSLISHRKFHNDYCPHECHLCPKKFKLRRSLENHIRTHTGERPYKCNLCPKAYNNSSRYNYHMKVTHSDNRPFTCSLCGGCFKTNKFLKRHLKLHTIRTHIQVRRRNNPVLFNKLHNITEDGKPHIKKTKCQKKTTEKSQENAHADIKCKMSIVVEEERKTEEIQQPNKSNAVAYSYAEAAEYTMFPDYVVAKYCGALTEDPTSKERQAQLTAQYERQIASTTSNHVYRGYSAYDSRQFGVPETELAKSRPSCIEKPYISTESCRNNVQRQYPDNRAYVEKPSRAADFISTYYVSDDQYVESAKDLSNRDMSGYGSRICYDNTTAVTSETRNIGNESDINRKNLFSL